MKSPTNMSAQDHVVLHYTTTLKFDFQLVSVHRKRTYTPKVRLKKWKAGSRQELNSSPLVWAAVLWPLELQPLDKQLLLSSLFNPDGIFPSTPSKVLMAHAEGLIEFSQHLLMGCKWATGALNTMCGVYGEECEGCWLSGGCSSVYEGCTIALLGCVFTHCE